MCSKSVRLARTFIYSLVIAALFVVCGGCVQQGPPQDQPVSNTSVTTNTNSNANVATTATAPAASQVQVTLPLVDALMDDEEFVSQARSSLQLTDDQVQKLKDAARNDVLTLDENDNSDTRSTARQ